MDKRLSKMLLDPNKLEALVGKYQSAVDKNKAALKDLTKGKSLKAASDEWVKRAESAKKEVLEAEAELESVHKDAENQVLVAQMRVKDIDDREKSVSALASTLLEKEAALNEKLSELKKDRLELDKEMAKLSSAKHAFANWCSDLSEVLSRRPE